MRAVNIKIGALVFDHADYDAEKDVLHLHVGAPKPADDDETREGHTVRYACGTRRIVGLTLVGSAKALGRDGRVYVTLPQTVALTEDDLAPALAKQRRIWGNVKGSLGPDFDELPEEFEPYT